MNKLKQWIERYRTNRDNAPKMTKRTARIVYPFGTMVKLLLGGVFVWGAGPVFLAVQADTMIALVEPSFWFLIWFLFGVFLLYWGTQGLTDDAKRVLERSCY